MEKPLYALLALADSASVGADPAKAAAALDGVSTAAVKKAAAAALKSGMSMASVGNIAEVRVCFFFFFGPRGQRCVRPTCEIGLRRGAVVTL